VCTTQRPIVEGEGQTALKFIFFECKYEAYTGQQQALDVR